MITKKKGGIELIIVSMMVTILIIFVVSICLLYIQINTYVYPIKEDIYYIVQNSFVVINKYELAYGDYVFDDKLMFEKVDLLISLNHKEAKLLKLNYNKNTNYVDVEVNLKVKPIILQNLLGEIDLKLKDRVKVKLMDVR